MKLSKYAALVKKGGHCIVAHVEGDGVWLGTSAAIYRAAELPDAEGEEQIRAMLDTAKRRGKRYTSKKFGWKASGIFSAWTCPRM